MKTKTPKTPQNVSLVFLLLLVIGCSDSTTADKNNTIDSQSAPTHAKSQKTPQWHLPDNLDLNGLFECLESEGKSLISAHRAGSYEHYPENALETAQYISSKMPALHEIDVATSSDGVLFLMHDDTLERTTTGSGQARDLSWAQIRTLNLEDKNGKRTPYHPPALEAFLKWAKDKAIVQIDFKRSTRYEDVITLVKKTGMEDQTIYIAYSMAQARKLHALAPNAMISVSIDSMSELNSAIGAGIPVDQIFAFTGTDNPAPRTFNLLNKRDIEVIFGTLGGRRSLDNQVAISGNDDLYTDLSKQGVDIIATDRPIEAYAALLEKDRGVNKPLCGIRG